MRYSRLLVVVSLLALMVAASVVTTNAGDTITWTSISPMGYDRFGHQSVLLPDGRVLVVGGDYEISTFTGPAEMYDPKTDSWSKAGWPQPWGEDHRITLLPNGKVLVVGGLQPELYDPATNGWTKAGTMQELRRWATATLLKNGKVLVAGGHIGTVDAGAELYDPETNS